MIKKIDIMLDPERYDGEYVGRVTKAHIDDNGASFNLNFNFDGREEQIVAEISLTRGLTRTTAMLREHGVKQFDALKNVKFVAFEIRNGWVNVVGFPDDDIVSTASDPGKLSGKFLK